MISETKDIYRVKIIDNGPRFSNTSALVDESYQSVGMSITSRRLQLINDDSYSTNSIQIMDRKDGENNSIGTIVQIKIKCLV